MILGNLIGGKLQRVPKVGLGGHTRGLKKMTLNFWGRVFNYCSIVTAAYQRPTDQRHGLSLALAMCACFSV